MKRKTIIFALFVLGKTGAGCCFADISTGEVHGVLLSGHLQEKLTNELSRFSPREILLNPEGLDLKDLPQFIRDRLCASLELLEETEFAAENSVPLVLKQFQKNSLEEMDLEEKEEIAYAAGALLWYLKKTQRTGLERLYGTLSLQRRPVYGVGFERQTESGAP